MQGNLQLDMPAFTQFNYHQGCDLEVGKIMYPKIPTLMSKKLKIMYIFQKIMYKKRVIPE